jgi:hypothetical protein
MLGRIEVIALTQSLMGGTAKPCPDLAILIAAGYPALTERAALGEPNLAS